MPGITRLSTTMPDTPKNADFAIYIEFQPGTRNPERIFQAADQAIRSFRELDHILCKSVDSKISPIMLLEEIETGSIKVWLKSVLENVDDNDLKKLDWRAIVGKFLVKGKYVFIEWTNNEHNNIESIKELQSNVRKLAEETGVRELPIYGEIDTKDIANIAININQIKKLLSDSDSMKYLTQDTEIEFDLSIYIETEKILDLLTKETIILENSNLILVVKKPDYLGSSKWDLKHNNRTISASIKDSVWLNKFQSREIDVRPGDALRCTVRIEIKYGYDNQILSESYFINSVDEVIDESFLIQPEIGE